LLIANDIAGGLLALVEQDLSERQIRNEMALQVLTRANESRQTPKQ
jgi:hypothetical protein